MSKQRLSADPPANLRLPRVGDPIGDELRAQGRERFYDMSDEQREAAHDEMAGLLACGFSDEAKFARGWFDEKDDKKRSCGASSFLCWRIHEQPCQEGR